jgi:hypothetical protein
VVFCPDEKRGKRDKKQWLNDMLQCQADARKAAGWSAEKVAQALQYAKVPIPEFEAGTLQCSQCSRSFGLLTKRHHCRCCGSVVCDGCSTGRADMRSLNAPGATDVGPWLNNERVCDDCVKLANIFYQDYARSQVIDDAEDGIRTPQIWRVPVVQMVQDTRRRSYQASDSASLAQVSTAEPGEARRPQQRERSRSTNRFATAQAAWRYAAKEARAVDYHHGSAQATQKAHGQVGLWAGWLWKQGQGSSAFGRTNWKKRWFVLTNEQLSYYESMEDSMRVTSRTAGGVRGVAKGSLMIKEYGVSSVDMDLMGVRAAPFVLEHSATRVQIDTEVSDSQ